MSKFDEIRLQFISFVDDLSINFSLIKEQKSLEVSTGSEKILKIILIFTYCTSFLAEVQYLKYWILICCEEGAL